MAKEPKERKALRIKMRGKAALLTGRKRKDAAMITARAMATNGGYTSFKNVVDYLAGEDQDSAVALRLWASASDRDAIDFICAKWSRTQKR